MNVDNLKREFEENPVLTLGVIAAATTGVAKLIDALSVAQGRRAYAKQINHKIKMK